MKIEDYTPNPNRKTYYVSPANSLCFMYDGIDYDLSRVVFPGIEQTVKNIVKWVGLKSIVAPTMLLPQNVSNTQNAYYATIAVLYNVLMNKKENLDDVDIIFTSFCCGYGKMDEEESIRQIMNGNKDYPNYQPKEVGNNGVIHEPNLYEQPKYYQNTEFFSIRPEEIVNC